MRIPSLVYCDINKLMTVSPKTINGVNDAKLHIIICIYKRNNETFSFLLELYCAQYGFSFIYVLHECEITKKKSMTLTPY